MNKSSCVNSEAIFGSDNIGRKHRYVLERVWDSNKEMAAIIMFNPSYADELKYDYTTMKVINYLIDKGTYGGVYILNLYSIVETNSKTVTGNLKKANISENNDYMMQTIKMAKDVFVAWGSENNKTRINEVKSIIKSSGHDCMYRFLNKDKKSIHPSKCTIVSDEKVDI